MLTAEKLKKFAIEHGADAVGIAPVDRFEGAPKEMDPRYIFPSAKRVIGFIFRIPRGYIRGIEEGTHFYQYPSLGYAGINERYAPTVIYEVGRYIEDFGFEAAAFRNTGGRGPISDMDGKPGFKASPEEHHRAVKYSHPARDNFPGPDIIFQFRIAAYLCGLGEIGYSKMLLTPDFGPLNRQAFILTDAELDVDPIYDGPEICDRCMACVANCPGKCISSKETVKLTLAGKEISWGKLNEWDCFIYYQGANKKTNPFLTNNAFMDIPGGDSLIDGNKHISPEEYNKFAAVLADSYHYVDGYNPPKCGGCLRACINNLEKKNRLRKSFKNRFRTRSSWRMK